MNNTAIVIPAMNEQDTISCVIESLRKHTPFNIIVVDDASSDMTGQIARSKGADVLTHVVNMGAWRSTQTGIRYALKNNYDRVVTFDADGQHNAESIEALIEESDKGRDLVIGSCISRGSSGRHLVWRVFKHLTGLPVSDLTSGFRCYSAKAMRALASRQATMLEYQDVGILLMIRNLKMQVSEVQVTMQERQNGISRIFHSWLAVFAYITYTFILSVTKAMPMSAKKYHKKLLAGEKLD